MGKRILTYSTPLKDLIYIIKKSLHYERTFITFVEIYTVKAPLWIKFSIYLPAILLADYVAMAILGCTTCLFGIGDDFYCGGYCIIGKIILALSAAFFLYLLYPDIVKLYKKTPHV